MKLIWIKPINERTNEMGIFSNILEKLGVKPKAEPVTTIPKTTTTTIPRTTTTTSPVKPGTSPGAGKYDLPLDQVGKPKATTLKPGAIPVVDVVAQLEKLAAANPEKLDWKKSIVDLLKLLGIDSSYAARKELAVELGCPPDKMDDSAEMNVWLHKTVLQKIADNGGNIPASMLD
jgi:hypothetical protein